MGLFRPYQSNDADDQGADQTSTGSQPRLAEQGKGAPTPSRREAEQSRREQLRPTLSKQERKAREREVRRVRDEKAWSDAEMRPERVLLRNFLDSRWTLSEFTWPLLMVAMAAFLAGSWLPQLSIFASYAIWTVMAAIIVELTWLWFKLKRELIARVPGAPRRGLVMYLLSRMVTMRRFRRPPTAIDRGASY